MVEQPHCLSGMDSNPEVGRRLIHHFSDEFDRTGSRRDSIASTGGSPAGGAAGRNSQRALGASGRGEL